MRKRNRRILPSCLPDDVFHDGIDFMPTREENRLAYHRQQIALALAEVKRIELEEQRAWLVAATQRAVVAGLLIDEDNRKIALQEEIDRTNKWWATPRSARKHRPKH